METYLDSDDDDLILEPLETEVREAPMWEDGHLEDFQRAAANQGVWIDLDDNGEGWVQDENQDWPPQCRAHRYRRQD